MSISATSMPNTIGTGFDVNSADLANRDGPKSTSMLRFDQSMARAEALQPQPVGFYAPEGVSAPQNLNATPMPDGLVLAQAGPPTFPNIGRMIAPQIVPPVNAAPTPAINEPPAITAPVEPSKAAPQVDGASTGQGIIDGLSRLRGVFDAQENAITGISSADTAGTRLTNSAELINLQLEVVKYSMLMDVTSKLAGKSTQTFDTLMKGQ